MITSFQEDGFEDYLYWQNQDKKTLKKINALINDIKRNGFSEGIGKPERLKYLDAWSRRIDDANRLIYASDDTGNLVIIACKGHYE